MDARRKQLRLRWQDVAERAGVSKETIRLLRKGARDESVRATETETKLEAALGWATGSIQAIRDDREPTLLADAAAARSSYPDVIYPDVVGADPFFRYIWDYPGDDATELDKQIAIRSTQMNRQVTSEAAAGSQAELRQA